MKKELELNVPISNCYQFNAYPLSILANKNECLPWIYSNFVNTCFDRETKLSPVPFYFYIFDHTSCPWLNVQKIKSNLLKCIDLDIIKFVEKSIKLNNYVVLIVNEFYIPNRKAFQKKNIYHDLMIYGIDSDKQELYVYGFDDNYMLSKTSVSYEQFVSSYQSVPSNILNDTVLLYEYNQNGHYHFNIDLFWENLEDYVNGVNVSEKFIIFRDPWDRAYGIEQYDYLYAYYKNAHIDDFYKDIKIIHFFYEHKYLMLKRFQYLQNNFEIAGIDIAIKKWENVVNTSKICRNLHLKGIACNNILKYTDKITNYLTTLEHEEIEIINTLISKRIFH